MSSDHAANARSELEGECQEAHKLRAEPGRPGLEIPDMILRAQQAFVRDLDELLATRAGQWVAYHGDRQIAFAARDEELYKACLRLQIDEEELLVRRIEPDTGMMMIGSGALD